MSGGAGTMDENIMRRIGADGDSDVHPARNLLPFCHARAAAGARHHIEGGGHGMGLALRRGLAHLFAIVLRAVLLALPVHACTGGVVDLHAVGAAVALAGLRVLRDDRGQRDEASAVERPALQDGEIEQREVVALDDFLAWPAGDPLGKELPHLGQHGQHFDLVQKALRRLHVHEVLDALGDFIQRIHLERQPHAALGTELVNQQLGAGIAFDVLEEQRWTAGTVFAARPPLGDAVGDLGDLQHRIGF